VPRWPAWRWRGRCRMPIAMAGQVTIYLNESDKWQGKPLHMAILNYLHDENVFAACTLHAVGGFLGRQRVKTSHLVDAGGKLPIIIIFVDTDERGHRRARQPRLAEIKGDGRPPHDRAGERGVGTREFRLEVLVVQSTT
jgi:PII-like signaling protein